MYMKFTISHAYSKDTDTLLKVLTDESYLMEKFEATGAKKIRILKCGERGGDFVISRQMEIPANPPGFAKKIIKAMNTVSATDTWQSFDSEKKTGVFDLKVKGVPGSLTGTITLNPTKKGCDYIIVFDVRVPIPLIGNKIAKIVENDTRSNQEVDYQFTRKYLENL
jgi:hypothetical protein